MKLDPDEYKDLIEDAWHAGLNTAAMHLLLNDELASQNLSCTSRTLERRLAEWGFQRQQRTPVTEELVDRVRYYFFKYGYGDKSILKDLRQEGYTLTPTALKVIRWQNGMKRRFRTNEEREAALGVAFQFLQDDLQRSAAIKGFGRGFLYNYIRLKAGILVSQNRLYEYYREQHPEEVSRRREDNWKYRRDFTVLGPNFLWSLDRYEKLKNFGFQVGP